jgi:glycosyltransferase involved in cell wall biosynthesis
MTPHSRQDGLPAGPAVERSHRRAPTISVVMPVYNARRYVAQAVESILAQTVTDFEFVIIDDGSTDGSTAILRRYAERDGRIRLVSRPNTGLVRALNEGLSLVRGPFVARMDADDISLPDRFALQLAAFRANDRLVALGGSFVCMDAAGRHLTRFEQPTDDATIQSHLLRGHCALGHPTAMMRREAALAVGGYDEAFATAEDLDLWLRLGERGELGNVPEVVLKYRLHAESVSEASGERQRQAFRRACEAAWKRRGVEGVFDPAQGDWWRPGPGRSSQHRYALQYGWWAFNCGERRTALHYGLRAVAQLPFASEGWRLLACAALKPRRAVAR